MSKNTQQEMEERFDAHLHELQTNGYPQNTGKDGDITFFGYKTMRRYETNGMERMETFTVVDWGNIKKFFQQELTRQKEESRAKIDELKEVNGTRDYIIGYLDAKDDILTLLK